MPIVAIVGRPNVGKSTLFNCIAGRKIAIESSEKNTTRDPLFFRKKLPNLEIDFCDTGGLVFEKNENENFEKEIFTAANDAIQNADCILFCIDFKEKITAIDAQIWKFLREKNTRKIPIFLAVLKSDRILNEIEKADFYEFEISAEKIFFISAIQNLGVKNFLKKNRK